MIRLRSSLRALLIGATLLSAPLSVAIAMVTPAYALFGFGDVVFDPTNYAEAVEQSARALEQINNQIQGLQNQAQQLINEARNLASLPYSSLQQLQQSISQTQQLLQQAQGIAFNVQQIDQVFSQQYSNIDLSQSDQQLIGQARTRWQNTVGALQDAMRVQAGAVGNIDGQKAQLAALVGQSQGATGALQATQAGNQLLALQSAQLADLVSVLSANGRADALVEGERAAAATEGQELRKRFLTPGAGYQPGGAQMFH
jgi:P-type conjugative transfer protein TrbJ